MRNRAQPLLPLTYSFARPSLIFASPPTSPDTILSVCLMTVYAMDIVLNFFVRRFVAGWIGR